MKWIVVFVVIIVGYFAYMDYEKRTECEEMALIAAIDTYPIDSNPSAAVRDSQQKAYQYRYMQSCMQ